MITFTSPTRRDYLACLGFVVALGLAGLAGYEFHKPEYREVTKVVEVEKKVETEKKTNAEVKQNEKKNIQKKRVKKVVQEKKPDGSERTETTETEDDSDTSETDTNIRFVEVTKLVEVEKKVEVTKEVTKVLDRKYSLGLNAGLDFGNLPDRVYEVEAGYRVLGPFWARAAVNTKGVAMLGVRGEW